MFFTNEYYNKIKIPASKTQVNLNIKTTVRTMGTKSKKRAATIWKYNFCG